MNEFTEHGPRDGNKPEPIYIHRRWFRCPECTAKSSVYMTQAGFEVAVPPTCTNCGLAMKIKDIIPSLFCRLGSWLWSKRANDFVTDVGSFDIARPFLWAWRGPQLCWEAVGWPLRKKPWGTYAKILERSLRILDKQQRDMLLARKFRSATERLRLAKLEHDKVAIKEEKVEEEVIDADFKAGITEFRLDDISRQRKLRAASPTERLTMLLHQSGDDMFRRTCLVCKVMWDTPQQAVLCTRSHREERSE